MTMNSRNRRDGLSIDRVKDRLKALATVEPPPSLKDTLEAGIPVGAADGPIMRGIGPWPRRIRRAGAAAAAVVAVSLFVWLGTPGAWQARTAFDANASSRQVYATDYNSLRPSDTNICDINSLR